MGINFEYKDNATVEHLNIRKEGSDKDVLAIDVKVNGETGGKVLAQILGCSDKQATGFWDLKSEEQRATYTGVTEIDTWTEFETCTVKIGIKQFRGAKVRRFKFKPINHHMLDLTCSISLSDIHDKDVAYLCEQMKEDVAVSIESQADMFDEGDDGEDQTEEV